VENEELVEISFSRKWDSSLQDSIAPINVDKRYVILIQHAFMCECGREFDLDIVSFRFIMRKDVTGFYSYAIFEHLAEWPAFNLPQTRIVYKLRKDK